MLKNKVAVVTGGTRGIGYAIVKKYLENGAKVVLFGSREETVTKALASLKEENAEWEVSGAWPNLGDADAVAKEMEAVKEKYGRIDILVNNAGVSDATPIDSYTSEQFSKVMQLNVNAVMNGIMPAVKIMKEQGGGCILNTSSMVSISGQRSCTWNHQGRYGSSTSETGDRTNDQPNPSSPYRRSRRYRKCIPVLSQRYGKLCNR